jgi:hypothetical protein
MSSVVAAGSAVCLFGSVGLGRRPDGLGEKDGEAERERLWREAVTEIRESVQQRAR